MRDFGDVESNLKEIVSNYNNGFNGFNDDDGDIYLNPDIYTLISDLPEQFPVNTDDDAIEEV